MSNSVVLPGAHTSPHTLLSLMDEPLSSLAPSQIQIQADFNPRAPLPGEADPFSEEALGSLLESVRTQGILQPLLVREHLGSYQLVAGERRLRVARILGLPRVPVLVRIMSDLQAREAALTENAQRLKLPYAQEALRGLRDLAYLTGVSLEEVPALLGRIRNSGEDPHGVTSYLKRVFGESVSTWLQQRARVLQLTPAERAALDAGVVGLGPLLPLLKLPTVEPDRAGLLEKIVSENWTAERVVREVALILTLTAKAPPLRGLKELRRALPRLEKLSPESLERAQALIDELIALR